MSLCLGSALSVPSSREAASTNDVADGTSSTIKTQTKQLIVFQDNNSSTPQQCIQCECVDCTTFVHSSSVHLVRVCSLHNVCTQFISASSASVFTAQLLYTVHQCIQCECVHCTTFVHRSSVHPVRVCSLHNIRTQIIGASSVSVLFTVYQCI